MCTLFIWCVCVLQWQLAPLALLAPEQISRAGMSLYIVYLVYVACMCFPVAARTTSTLALQQISRAGMTLYIVYLVYVACMSFTVAARTTSPAGSTADLTCWDDIIHCVLVGTSRAHQRPINLLACEGGRVLTGSQDHTLKVSDKLRFIHDPHGHI